jgi:hypothetical protein
MSITVNDSLFRSLYSRVECYRIASQERDRATHAGLYRQTSSASHQAMLNPFPKRFSFQSCFASS